MSPSALQTQLHQTVSEWIFVLQNNNSMLEFNKCHDHNKKLTSFQIVNVNIIASLNKVITVSRHKYETLLKNNQNLKFDF